MVTLRLRRARQFSTLPVGGRGMSSSEASPSRPNAELSAAYLCAEAGISSAVIENEAAYLQGWLTKLRSEKRLIVIAAAKAQKAADYILNRTLAA
jgi:antirestriction protein ArdC